MSQIDKIIYLPLIIWFIIIFVFLYFIIWSLFIYIILITTKTRILYLNFLYNFSKGVLKSTEFYIRDLLNLNQINYIISIKPLSKK